LAFWYEKEARRYKGFFLLTKSVKKLWYFLKENEKRNQ